MSFLERWHKQDDQFPIPAMATLESIVAIAAPAIFNWNAKIKTGSKAIFKVPPNATPIPRLFGISF